MEEITAGTLAGLSAQRTVARSASNATNALCTPDTLWMASVTCRAQLLHVMPVTSSSVVDEPLAGCSCE